MVIGSDSTGHNNRYNVPAIGADVGIRYNTIQYNTTKGDGYLV